GYTVASAYPQDWAAQGYSSGWTELVGVLRAHRGRGLAPALLTASMRGMAADGMERADLGVDSENGTGALGVYTRLGYRAAGRTVSYTKEL
ncbi:GNAT family N-acetyltransferase, partial [Georgenia sp. 10Sc9-8]|nr:GNAT family N-acetyltransferase [Georgenia halotolerans]